MGKRIPLGFALVGVMLAMPALHAQNARVALSGHVQAGAIAGNDQGRVEASLVMRHVTALLQPSAAQQADLAEFLTRQQEPASPDYHHWLTPEEYGERFGVAQAEIDQITAWLTSQNLTVDSVGRGRNTVSFTGAVRDVEKAFATEIHRYSANGETHFANAGEPSVPAAFRDAIRAVHGLNDYRLKPAAIRQPQQAAGPLYTSTTTGRNYLAPDDVATIFDIVPLYNSGITGKGQKIVVVGQTRINLADIQQFRTYFNLSANDPQTLLVPNTVDPGISSTDLPEAHLDVEWTGAIARDATILFVYSQDVTDALYYAINQNLAPVISMSYGLCEGLTGSASVAMLRTYAQQASAQGMSWITASGDSGANDCYGVSSRGPTGLSVDAPASVPEVTGVGGTTLTEGSGTYWNTTNNANHASALSYIPEAVWNDSVQDGSASSSGGGASSIFAKPVWQVGPGVPSDGARDVPDVAMPGSADHDAYLVYTSGTLQAFGGTSVGAPVFAGIAGLLNQYLTANGLQAAAGLGSMNSRLYALAQSSPNVFHDVTTGNNIVDSCAPGARNCVAAKVGYNAGPGYDQATGLGSVDAWNLVAAWHQSGAAAKAVTTTKVTSGSTFLAATDSTVLTATVSGSSGSVPTGTVTFYLAGVALGSGNLIRAGSTGTATLSVTAVQLSAGSSATTTITDPVTGAVATVTTPVITVIYGGDSVYASASATVTVTVAAPTALVLNGLSSAASFKAAYAPGMIVAMFGQNLATSSQSAPSVPLPKQLAGVAVTINGISAPLYYVSPGQINLQIPYEVASGSTAIVKITSGGQSATSQISVTATAPGIFADTSGLLVPYQTAGRGQTITLYLTGEGRVSPLPVTGSLPSAGTTPVPAAKVSVTVGGVAAATTYVGVPAWSIGVTQVNFTIPANAPLGLQPVVVTAGAGTSASSAPAYITVTQ